MLLYACSCRHLSIQDIDESIASINIDVKSLNQKKQPFESTLSEALNKIIKSEAVASTIYVNEVDTLENDLPVISSNITLGVVGNNGLLQAIQAYFESIGVTVEQGEALTFENSFAYCHVEKGFIWAPSRASHSDWQTESFDEVKIEAFQKSFVEEEEEYGEEEFDIYESEEDVDDDLFEGFYEDDEYDYDGRGDETLSEFKEDLANDLLLDAKAIAFLDANGKAVRGNTKMKTFRKAWAEA